MPQNCQDGLEQGKARVEKTLRQAKGILAFGWSAGMIEPSWERRPIARGLMLLVKK
jgi:hypothetical protein